MPPYWMKVPLLLKQWHYFWCKNCDQKKNNTNKFFPNITTNFICFANAFHTNWVELVVGNHESFDFSSEYFGAILQYPGKFGQVHDYAAFIASCWKRNQSSSCCWYFESGKTNSSRRNAAVVLNYTTFWYSSIWWSTRRFFATKEEYKRSMPGRIIGVTVDTDETAALRMALQTREQHITW
jgi:glycine dehydrogenase